VIFSLQSRTLSQGVAKKGAKGHRGSSGTTNSTRVPLIVRPTQKAVVRREQLFENSFTTAPPRKMGSNHLQHEWNTLCHASNFFLKKSIAKQHESIACFRKTYQSESKRKKNSKTARPELLLFN
jgi:hypothetical protein